MSFFVFVSFCPSGRVGAMTKIRCFYDCRWLFFFLKKVACNYLSSPDTKGPGIGSLYPINTFCQHFVVYFQTGCREPRTEKKKKNRYPKSTVQRSTPAKRTMTVLQFFFELQPLCSDHIEKGKEISGLMGTF